MRYRTSAAAASASKLYLWRARFVEEMGGSRASCTDCCIVLCWSYPVAGGGGCSCMLLLHPIPTSTDADPDLCTLWPDLCALHSDLCTLRLWCFPSFNWCNIPLAQVVVVASCNLCWWCFILQPPAQIVHLHTWWFTLCNLCWWCFILQPHAEMSLLQEVVRNCGQ